jgi:hypothetical protein
MTTRTKLALAAILMLGICSAAQAGGSKNNEVGGGSAPSALPCPALEGYPDCHPGARGSWAEDSAYSRYPNRSQYQRRP